MEPAVVRWFQHFASKITTRERRILDHCLSKHLNSHSVAFSGKSTEDILNEKMPTLSSTTRSSGWEAPAPAAGRTPARSSALAMPTPTQPLSQLDLATATLLLPTISVLDVPCMIGGGLGATSVCEASRISTGDCWGCDASERAALTFHLYSIVTKMAPMPGVLRFLEVVSHTEQTERPSTGPAAFRE